MLDDEKQSAPTLRDYLLVVRRRKWTFFAVVVLIPTFAVLFSLHQPRTYQASAEVLLNQQSLPPAVTGAQQSPYVDPARVAQTQALLARVPEVTTRALKAVPEANLTTEEFLKTSAVSTNTGSDLLTFTVKHTDPEIARRLATAHARAFTRYRHSLDTDQVVRTHKAVQLRLAELESAGLRGTALYRSLVQTDRELTTFEALQTPTAVVVEPAERATKVGPKTVLNGALGLALGLVLGLGLMFLLEALDTRVRSAKTIRDVLGLRLLGSVPPPPRNLRKDDRLVMMAAPMTIEAEPFRALRTSLEFANSEIRARTIMITSALDGEGKSTTAANLAVALARAGRRVVLVDFDLRNPSLHRLFELGERSGLSQIDLGDEAVESSSPLSQLSEDDAATDNGRPTRHEGKLEVLPAGHLLSGPDDLADELMVAKVLQSLENNADLVLIDAAPLLPVGDSIALSAHVDGLLLVVRLNDLRQSALEHVQRVLSTSPVPKLGFVVTGAKPEQTYQRYRYGTSRLPHVSRSRNPDEMGVEKKRQRSL